MNNLLSEWTKLGSVRMTWILVLSTIASSVALSLLGVSEILASTDTALPPSWDPTATALKGFLFAQLIIGMMGALSFTAEFETGTIAGSLISVPSRLHFFGAKIIAVTVLAMVTACATTLLSFLLVQAALSNAGIPTADLSQTNVQMALGGAVLYLVLVALIGVAVGVLTRSATMSMSVLVAVLLLTPAVGPGLPGAIGPWFAAFWPITAGQAAYAVVPIEGNIDPFLGLAILAATATGLCATAYGALQYRDI
jgi:hypothetical protein